MDVRALDRLIDVDYDGVCEDLEKDKINLQKAIQSNSEMLPLIKDQKEKARMTEVSREHLHASIKAAGGQHQLPPSDDDMIDVDDGQDGSLVDQCTKAYTERADALQIALESNAKVKRMVEEFEIQLQVAREDFPAQVDLLQKNLRLEYKGRLSQQRKELGEKVQKKKAKFKIQLKEK